MCINLGTELGAFTLTLSLNHLIYSQRYPMFLEHLLCPGWGMGCAIGNRETRALKSHSPLCVFSPASRSES